MKIAIIDIIGLPYDGTTVFSQGLGGSESAVTFMAIELAKLGFDVTVFNNCNIDHARPGNYSGVVYRPLSDLTQDHYFDIVVSSRTIIPFTEPARYGELNDYRAMPLQPWNLYDRIVARAKMRVLWMHDTFCLGDNMIEELALANRITDIFTLSDFHLTYVANCHHGRRRNFEVLKPKLFITRNGANCYTPEVDIAAKDRNLFVYNASVTKGMIPLVDDIWPRVKQAIPAARLKVIGGYYRFSSSSEPDQQEQDWRRMVADPRYAGLGIEFTGVIPQQEIGQILTQANFMIYPCAFPETFGISTLESLLHNTPVITCRFGALEEVALEKACYLIDYAVEPNGLFPDINKSHQVEKFVQVTVQAYNNTYLHQQKQYYCNAIKDISGWDSVALQWKQHFYKKTGCYLTRDQYRAVTKINHKVHRLWQRRFTNTVEFETHRVGQEQEIVVVSTFYNCKDYIARCIESVVSQDYDNYRHILVNDCSTDNTMDVIVEYLDQLPERLQEKFTLINNTTRVGAVCNQVTAFREIDNPEAIIMILDGDDSLVNDNSIFAYYNSIYDGTTEFTYGSCWSVVDNIPLISQPYPGAVKQSRSYRQHHFNWILPYTHLRTFKQRLIKQIPDSDFQDDAGNWFKAGGDGSVFYSLIEAADPARVKCLQEIVYNYNDASPLNDYKVNGAEQNQTARAIIEKKNKTITMNNQDPLIREYQLACAVPSDINQHLPMLNQLANACSTVVELGVRTGVSTRALLAADCELYSYDLSLDPTVVNLFNIAKSQNKKCEYSVANSLTMDIPETDLLFIDTDHTYQQLFTELERHHHRVRKYIAFHDTFTYGLKTDQDPLKGLFTAIVEFMTRHPEWRFKYHTSENNGFTVIEKTEQNHQYSVIVPTMWRVAEQFKNFVVQLCQHSSVGEIIVINNDNSKTPADFPVHEKIKILDYGKNIFVNPAWNQGVRTSRFNKICIVNDDVIFDLAVFKKLENLLTPESGIFGLCPGVADFNQTPVTTGTIDIVPWTGQHTYGFGCLMFLHKDIWREIPDGLDIYYGDNFIFDLQLHQKKTNYLITNMYFESQFAATTSDKNITGGFLDRETPIYQEIKKNFGTVQLPEKKPQQPNKRILIAIPTARNIEPDTFKSIYDLEVPQGYETDFQYFYGYNIDQVRNLIADWVVRGYDYLFSVDSDIAFPPDTLKRLLAHNVDMVSGLYIQRKPGQHILEVYEHNSMGGVSNIPYEKIVGRGLVEIAGSGFGCVLVKAEVIRAIPYPHFVYHSAIDHRNTVSEDVDFCRKVLERNFHIWADTSILCRHIGATEFLIDTNIQPIPQESPVEARLRELYNQRLLPYPHVEYLQRLASLGLNPSVVYDVGACVLHWTNEARRIWPNAQYYVFEAMSSCEFLYKENNLEFHTGLISDRDGRQLDFYQNEEHPGGNSYYRENSEVNPDAPLYFNESHRRSMISRCLDSIVAERNFPPPELLKIDVQGAEMDILSGALTTLQSVTDVILELQVVEYNKGAPLRDKVIEFMDGLGFDCLGLFCNNGPDGDYHFRRRHR